MFRLGQIAGSGLAVGAAYAMFNGFSTKNQEAAIKNYSAFAASSIAGDLGTSSERTFIAIKPDGVQRGLLPSVIKRMERKGYQLVAIKMLTPSKELAQEHYADLSERPFYPKLVDYMSGSGPVVAMVWQGKDVIKYGRTMIGATNPLASAPGTIRGDFAVDVGRNVIHGSDSHTSAENEINLWFKPAEIQEWKPAAHNWVYEQ